MNMPSHMFVASSGELFDTRVPQWSKKALRATYSKTCMDIDNAQEFKATLRAGKYAWPGGYPMYLICSDGGPLCFDCARTEARNIITAIQRRDGSGWRVTATDINYEDEDLVCEHCNQKIESACGDA